MVKEIKEILETPIHTKYTIPPEARKALAVGIKKDFKLDESGEKSDVSEIIDYQITELDSYEGVVINSSPTGTRPIYNVILPELDTSDWKKLNKYKEAILNDPSFDPSFITDIDEMKKSFSEEAKRIIENESSIQADKVRLLVDLLTKSVIGYGLIEFLLVDDLLEEIMILGENKKVYVIHRNQGMCSTNLSFEYDEEVVNIITRMAREVGRKIDRFNPLLDTRLRDGSRVNATVKPITPRGATLTIRKFMADPLTIIDLVKNGTMSLEFAAWLWIVVDGLGVKPANILISGGTSSGKTTTLNSLTAYIPEEERIVSIEDTLELQLNLHEHWIQMETRQGLVEGEKKIDMNDCLINTLRMRPDRIIVGEVRGVEAETLFAAMNTGHDGCLGTVHANDAKETITRLTNPPMDVPMIMLPALDLIIIQSRFKHPQKGNIRRIIEVSELSGMEEGKILMNKIYSYNIRMDTLVDTGTPSRLNQDLSKRTGINAKQIHLEIAKRGKILSWLVENNKRSLNEVNKAIILFNRDPDIFMKKINIS
jgi:flagellar protein FlaI